MRKTVSRLVSALLLTAALLGTACLAASAADVTFSDVKGHWGESYIYSGVQKGYINGYTDGTFKPNQYITRAEAMKIVNGILGRDSVTGDLLDDMVIWSDNLDPDAWYYYIVQEATNSHEYVIDNDEETWTAALPNRDWSELEKVDTEM